MLLAALALTEVVSSQAPSWVAGTVHDHSGSPVVGAEVLVISHEPKGLPGIVLANLPRRTRTLATVRTNEGGRFVIRYEPSDELSLVAVDPSGARSQPIGPIAPGSSHALTLRRLVSIEARIEAEADGLPISAQGMAVVASVPVRSAVDSIDYGADDLGDIETATADAAGRVVLHTLEGVACRLRLVNAGVEMRFVAPPREEVVMKARLHRRALRVTDPLRAPVPGALVSRGGFATAQQVETDANGVANFLATSPTFVAVTAPGYRWTSVTLNRPTVRVELEFAQPIRMQLREGNQPLAARRLMVFGYASGSAPPMPCVRELSTGADGSVELFGRSRSHGMIVWMEDGDGYRRVYDISKSIERVDLGSIDVTPIEYVGRILAADGAGASHAPIFPISTTDPFGHEHGLGRLPLVFSDHAGRFRLTASANIPVEIAVQTAQHTTLFAVLPRRPTKAIELRLQTGQDIEGVILDPAGAPIAGQTVTLMASPKQSPAQRFGLPRRWMRTDVRGRFVFPPIVENTPHFVSTSVGGHSPIHENVIARPGQKGIVITIPRSD